MRTKHYETTSETNVSTTMKTTSHAVIIKTTGSLLLFTVLDVLGWTLYLCNLK